jgi:hypothetical protein
MPQRLDAAQQLFADVPLLQIAVRIWLSLFSLS